MQRLAILWLGLVFSALGFCGGVFTYYKSHLVTEITYRTQVTQNTQAIQKLIQAQTNISEVASNLKSTITLLKELKAGQVDAKGENSTARRK